MTTAIDEDYGLTIPQGGTLKFRLIFSFSCLGKTAYAQVWDSKRRELLLPLTVTWIDREEVVPDTDPQEVQGVVEVSATWQQTAALKGVGLKAVEIGMWDFLLIDDATEERDYYVRGRALLEPRATAEADAPGGP